MWKKHRFQGLAAEDARQIIDEFGKLKVELTSTADLLNEAYRLAVTHGRTVYDAMYIALSMREQCPYVTADEKLVNAVRKAILPVVSVADWQSAASSE